MIVFASKPLQRDPSKFLNIYFVEKWGLKRMDSMLRNIFIKIHWICVSAPKDIEAIEEDEDVVEAKNEEYIKNMKRKIPSLKAKNEPMKEFAIKNENFNKDDQTVPMQAPVPGQSAVTANGGTGATGGGGTGAQSAV